MDQASNSKENSEVPWLSLLHNAGLLSIMLEARL